MAVRATTREDLRETERAFFIALPKMLLLSMHPDQLPSPGETTHLAALALIQVDPNLQGSQFLQSWAIQDRQMIRSGPGVTEEFLWADPYLPGVGYQNLDTWTYLGQGYLFARSDWTTEACWLRVSPAVVETRNCLTTVNTVPASFGHLTLVPLVSECVHLRRRNPMEELIVWKAKPLAALVYVREDKDRVPLKPDSAGMILLGADVEGKVCAASP
jgi:hypothetical protein